MTDLAPTPDGRPGVLVLGSDFKALGLIRSLGRRGIPSAVVDALPRSAWFSKHVGKRFRWQTDMSDPALVDFLLDVAADHRLQGWVLIPVQDDAVELVARHAGRLSGAYRLVTQDWQVVRWAHEKRLLYEVAQKLGISHPRTWYPTDERDLASLSIEYPAIIKPSVSIKLQYATGQKALPARDDRELITQYRRAAGVDSGTLMVQEVIPGDGRAQYSVATYCKDGRPIVAMTARRTRQFPADYGLSSSFVEAIEVPELMEPTRKLLEGLRLSGMIEVEFKLDVRDGQYKLLDVNVRPWAWHTLCIACGIDFAYMQYCDALGQSLPAASVRYGASWRRFITDVPAALQEMRAGTITPWAYLRSLITRRAVPSVFDPRDPVPALGDLGVALLRLSGRRGRSGPSSSRRRSKASVEQLTRRPADDAR
jgi:D-aspartate ligase